MEKALGIVAQFLSFSKFAFFFSILLTLLILFPSAVRALDPSNVLLDKDGVDFQFSSSSAGTTIDIYGINIGRIGSYLIKGDGRIRLDLSRIPPRPNVCFFAINPRNSEIVSLSKLRGFRNPFWEKQDDGRPAAPPRAVATIEADITKFEADLVSAKQVLQSEQGKRYRNGSCQSQVVTDRPKPAYGFDGANASYYGAARCAAVIARRPMTCTAVRAAADLGADTSFGAAGCEAKLSSAMTLIGSTREHATAQRHDAIAQSAAAEAMRNPAQRAAIAGRCIATIAELSSSQLADWRNERDQGSGAEGAALDRCTAALTIVSDEDIRRDELRKELAAAKVYASTPKKAAPVLSRSARDYPCAPS